MPTVLFGKNASGSVSGFAFQIGSGKILLRLRWLCLLTNIKISSSIFFQTDYKNDIFKKKTNSNLHSSLFPVWSNLQFFTPNGVCSTFCVVYSWPCMVCPLPYMICPSPYAICSLPRVVCSLPCVTILTLCPLQHRCRPLRTCWC